MRGLAGDQDVREGPFARRPIPPTGVVIRQWGLRRASHRLFAFYRLPGPFGSGGSEERIAKHAATIAARVCDARRPKGGTANARRFIRQLLPRGFPLSSAITFCEVVTSANWRSMSNKLIACETGNRSNTASAGTIVRKLTPRVRAGWLWHPEN
jgi:hypothetical protein